MKKFISLLSAAVIGFSALPMTVIAEDTAPEIQKGDVNADGVIDMTDACLVVYYSGESNRLIGSEDHEAVLKESVPFYEGIQKYGDMTGDGVVNAKDATLILKASGEKVEDYAEGEKGLDCVKYLMQKGILSDKGDSISPGKYMLYPAGKSIKQGDVNADGIIDERDATRALNFATKMNASMDSEKTIDDVINEMRDTYDWVDDVLMYGDMNGDGNVDGRDATLILKIATDARKLLSSDYMSSLEE